MNFEEEISSFLRQQYVGEIIADNRLTDLYPQFVLPEKKIVFLLVSIPTASLDDSQEMRFQNLAKQAAQQGLQLVIIWEDIWRDKNEIVRWRILAHIGVFTRIHARQCNVRKIQKSELDDFMLKNNLYESTTAKHKLGLFFNDEMVAAASFSSGRPILRGAKTYRSFELIRFANLKNYVVAGGLSKLISHFIASVKPDDIMTYADLDWSQGKGYEKLGFEFVMFTYPQKFYVDACACKRYSLNRLPANVQEAFNQQNLPLDEFLASCKIFSTYNAGNKKFLLKLI